MRLNQLLKEVNAKEFAMDNATKQNSDLLKLLLKAEADAEEVRVERVEGGRGCCFVLRSFPVVGVARLWSLNMACVCLRV